MLPEKPACSGQEVPSRVDWVVVPIVDYLLFPPFFVFLIITQSMLSHPISEEDADRHCPFDTCKTRSLPVSKDGELWQDAFRQGRQKNVLIGLFGGPQATCHGETYQVLHIRSARNQSTRACKLSTCCCLHRPRLYHRSPAPNSFPRATSTVRNLE
jgi:hypothetical protein